MDQRDQKPTGGAGRLDCPSKPNWTASMGPMQCAVYLTHVDTSAALKSDGSFAVKPQDYVCFIFDTFKEAHEFCKSKVRHYPFMSCEIYDSAGKAKPPLLVVKHTSFSEEDEASGSRIRKTLGVALIASALILFVLAWRADESWVFLTVIGPVIGYFMIVTGLRLLDWNLAIKEANRERERRLQAHLDREKQMMCGRASP